MCRYINRKKDVKEKINNPLALIEINLNFAYFFERKNWEMAKSNDSHRERFPKNAVINRINITTFCAN